MEQQDILNCLGKIKVTIASAGKSPTIGGFGRMVVNSLDPRSKNKYNELKEFLPQLETMEQNIINDINAITPLSQHFQTELENLHDKKNTVIENITHCDNEISDLRLRIDTNNVEVKKCDDHLSQLRQYYNEAKRDLENKRSELNQAWIPIYGLIILKKLQRIEREEIPRIIGRIYELEQEERDIYEARREYLARNESEERRIFDLQNQISSFQTELKEITDDMNRIHKEIASHINTMTYLSILHQRMETLYYHGGTDAKVMAVLDKSPEVMEYDDDVYFELLDLWKENHDEKVFQDFIMKAEKDFFSMN